MNKFVTPKPFNSGVLVAFEITDGRIAVQNNKFPPRKVSLFIVFFKYCLVGVPGFILGIFVSIFFRFLEMSAGSRTIDDRKKLKEIIRK